MNRREFFGMASVGVITTALGVKYFLSRGTSVAQGGAFRVHHTDMEWRAKLSAESYRVLREDATEMRFSSPLVAEHREGIFACAGCDQPLFRSNAKYDSHTGWPSFWETLPNATIQRADFKTGTPRTEIRCSSCGGHLGHVFSDGPPPTGQRYCMNGVAMTFKPDAT